MSDQVRAAAEKLVAVHDDETSTLADESDAFDVLRAELAAAPAKKGAKTK